MHDNALAGLIKAGHQLLVDYHFGDEGVHVVHLQLEHLRQHGLEKGRLIVEESNNTDPTRWKN